MAGNTGEVKRSGLAHTAARSGRPDTAVTGVEAVLRLAEELPALEAVRAVGEHDRSDLTQTEQRQMQQTEEVIGTALAAGDAALWVIAQGLERAVKGRWWRATHDSLTAYVEARIGRSAVYVRQLRMNAPLALETARRTGTVPKPSQMKVTRKTEQQHGLDAAVALYEIVRDVTAELGGQTTAEGLIAVHDSLPEHLPEQGDAQRAVIEQVARHALASQPSAPDPDHEPLRPVPRMAGHWQIRSPAPGTLRRSNAAATETPEFEQKPNKSASIEALLFESGSNEGASIAAPVADTAPPARHGNPRSAQDTAATCKHLRTLEGALAALDAIDQNLTGDIYVSAAADPAHALEYERIRQDIITRATAIQAKALHAPTT
ncbi:hypothetical protein ACFWD7_23655 [Streptomyces mirabilis]|uniref:hypothetical protein n=1 Tax=Streptomyces mirabilis TaxID=68239 RepID=UPI00368A2C7C